jgi:outer membrane protein insertion porin family
MRCLLVVMLLASVAQAAPKIELVGNAKLGSTELLSAIDHPFDANGRLVDEIFERDLLLLSAYYWDRGYALVKIGAPVITPTTIRIPITENERFTLGNLAIAGDPTPRMRARHHDALQIRPGDIFSRSALAAERERLSRYYEERGYAYVNVIPLTKVDLDKKTIAVTFEIERGKQATIERIDVGCPLVADAAGAVTFGVGDLFDVAQLEASKRAIAAAGRLDPTTVVMSTRRGKTDELVAVGFDCQ